MIKKNNTLDRYWVAVVFSFILLMPVTLWASEDKVTFDVVIPTRIFAGDPFGVQFVLQNGDGKNISFRVPDGIEVLYGPATSRSKSTTMINGKISSSSSTTYTYTLSASKEGSYTIPAASVQVGTAIYRTEAVNINVLPSNSDSQASHPSREANRNATLSSDDFFITVTANNRNPYEQEGILLTFKLYSKREQFNIPSVKLPEFDGFIKEDLSQGQPQLKYEEYKGQHYFTVEIYQALLFPQRAGQLTIPIGSFDISALVQVNQPSNSIFSIFREQFQEVNTTVKSPQLTINVKPLPNPKPANFKGAVGRFVLTADIPTNIVKTNESFRYSITLSGSGNMKLVEMPVPDFPEGFEVYDPKETDELIATATGTTGKKLREHFAVPRYVGDYSFPALSMSYFDPKSGLYKELTLPEVKVHVDQGEGQAPTMTSTFSGQQEVKYLGEDIRYLKSADIQTYLKDPSISNYLLFYIVVTLFATSALLYVKYKNGRAESIQVKSRRADRMVRKYLKFASKLKEGDDDMAYYDALLTGLNNYFSTKLHIPMAELSKEQIQLAMSQRNTTLDFRVEVIQLLNDLEMLRYSPVKESGLKNKLYDRASEVIKQLQKIK